MWSNKVLLLLGILTFCNFITPNLAETPTDTASQAIEILQQNCGSSGCHGGPGGYRFDVHDPGSLLTAKVVEPGNAAASELIQRVEAGIMPLGGYQRQRGVKLPVQDIRVLRAWIDSGAQVPTRSIQARHTFISEAEALASIVRDLEFTSEADRSYLRYFSLANVWNNAEIETSELELYPVAIGKLVNHLSWRREITPPRRLGVEGALLRIDLRDYDWTPEMWLSILRSYPYAAASRDLTDQIDRIETLSGVRVPYIRADWFIAAASTPPLYHTILRLPNTLADLESLLLVDTEFDLQHNLARRFGLINSGVSRNNRAMERHATVYGAYWKSFDFSGNNPEQNIFRNPLDLRADGGEVIFHLPNGLQGYFIVDRLGRRIDEAPVNIVRDKTNPDDPVVRNGRSCMGCHVKGMNAFRDEVGGAVDARAQALFDIDRARSLYAGQPELDRLLDADNRRFAGALAHMGNATPKGSDDEPVSRLARKYEAPLSAAQAAADLYIEDANALQQRVAASPELQIEGLDQLLGAKASIKRDAWEHGFGLARFLTAP